MLAVLTPGDLPKETLYRKQQELNHGVCYFPFAVIKCLAGMIPGREG